VHEIAGELRCTGQLVAAPSGRYDWIYVRLDGVEANGDLEEVVWLHYETAVDPEWLRAAPGATVARLPVTRPERLLWLRLPERPDLRVLALTPAGPHRPESMSADGTFEEARHGPADHREAAR
jgi:hypothetical protein